MLFFYFLLLVLVLFSSFHSIQFYWFIFICKNVNLLFRFVLWLTFSFSLSLLFFVFYSWINSVQSVTWFQICIIIFFYPFLVFPYILLGSWFHKSLVLHSFPVNLFFLYSLKFHIFLAFFYSFILHHTSLSQFILSIYMYHYF